MIIGIGTDLVDIGRIQSLMEKEQSIFVQRLLSERETEMWSFMVGKRRKAEWIAGRFAAKEALAKALNTEVAGMLRFAEIEILPEPSGKPRVVLSPELEKLAVAFHQAPIQIHLSITHTASTAGAFAVVETRRHSACSGYTC